MVYITGGMSPLSSALKDAYPSDTKPPGMTASEEVFTSLNEARNLASAVRDMVSRLCGHSPEVAECKPTNAVPSAVFPSLREAAREASESIRSAQYALERLHNELN